MVPTGGFADGGVAAWTVGTDIVQDHCPVDNVNTKYDRAKVPLYNRSDPLSSLES